MYVGMGCEVFFINKNEQKLSIFMHSDSWGQYGPNTDDTPLLNSYINYCVNITESFEKQRLRIMKNRRKLSESPIYRDF